MKAPVYDLSGARLREVELADEVFGIEPNESVVHQALVRQDANRRQGTHATQTRSEVDRTGKKWFRQKGTGNARHGSRRAPIFVGGGVAHGPKPRDYSKRMPKRMRRLALRSALSARAAEGAVALVDGLSLDAPRTKTMAGLVQAVGEGGSVLLVLAGRDENVERSVRNLANAKYLHAPYLNVRDLLGHDRILLGMDALERVVDHLGEAATEAATEAVAAPSAVEEAGDE